jgi:hypothetical protein
MSSSSYITTQATIKTGQSNRMATVALAGISYFIVVVMVLHFLQPDLHVLYRYISEYAVGRYGWLMTSAFYGLSLGSFSLTLGLYRKISRKGRSWVGLMLLAMWSFGILVAGIYKADLITAIETPEGNIHSQVSLLTFISLVTSSFFLLHFRKDIVWKSYYRLSLVLSVGIVLSFLAFFWTIFTNHAMVGFTQRIFITMVLLWLLQMAIHLQSAGVQGESAETM